MENSPLQSDKVYRLDRFIVPASARAEFLARVHDTHNLLRAQPGFIQDFLLESPHGDDSVLLATLVEWRDQRALADARAAVARLHHTSGLDVQKLLHRLGIEAEIGNYKSVQT